MTKILLKTRFRTKDTCVNTNQDYHPESVNFFQDDTRFK